MYNDDAVNPKISVIMPCYNTAEYTDKTIDSILGQSFSDYELICIDDGSTDNTWEILREYEKKFDRIHVYKDENHGQGYQRNVGLQRARGKYVYFMDSDDELDPFCFEKLYYYAEENLLDVLYFEADTFYESEELEHLFPQYKTLYHRDHNYTEIYNGEKLFVKYMQAREFIVSTCLQFIRSEHLLENQIRFLELPCFEDNLFTIQVLLCAERVGCIPDVLYFRRLRADSVMTKKLEKARFTSYYEVLLAHLKILSLYSEQPDVQQAISKRIGIICKNLNKDYSRLTEEQRANYFSSDDSENLYFMIMMQQYCDIEKAQLIERKKAIDDKNKKLCEKNMQLNVKLQNISKEKTKINDKLQQTYREKSELNAKLQQTYREKSERGEELKELKSHFLVRVDRKLRRRRRK